MFPHASLMWQQGRRLECFWWSSKTDREHFQWGGRCWNCSSCPNSSVCIVVVWWSSYSDSGIRQNMVVSPLRRRRDQNILFTNDGKRTGSQRCLAATVVAEMIGGVPLNVRGDTSVHFFFFLINCPKLAGRGGRSRTLPGPDNHVLVDPFWCR